MSRKGTGELISAVQYYIDGKEFQLKINDCFMNRASLLFKSNTRSVLVSELAPCGVNVNESWVKIESKKDYG